jgi:hypothetical protein
MDHTEINNLVKSRRLYSGNDDDTYYNETLYGVACQNYTDPYLLFKLAIYGYYKSKYKWTQEQADWFIETQKENSVSWTDGAAEYYYDWGKGKNKVTEDYFHVPHLDHIIPSSLGERPDDRPENFRIRCRRLNENRGNTNSNKERRATIIDMFSDIDDKKEQQALLKYLKNLIHS